MLLLQHCNMSCALTSRPGESLMNLSGISASPLLRHCVMRSIGGVAPGFHSLHLPKQDIWLCLYDERHTSAWWSPRIIAECILSWQWAAACGLAGA